MVFVKLFLLLFIFTSCHSSRIVEQKSLFTTFEADSLFFLGVKNPKLYYKDLLGVTTLSINLSPNKKVSVLISKPTMFQCFPINCIVYPGENVSISIDKNEEITFEVKSNEQRTRELKFQNVFQMMDQKIRPQFPNRTRDYPIDTVLLFEQKIKSEIPGYIKTSTDMLDSLALAYKISNTFKMFSRAILKSNQFSSLHYVYYVYPKVLKENNLYLQKQRELLPVFNNITNKYEMYFGGSYYVESIANEIMESNIRLIKSEDGLKEAIDSINNNFKSLSKDFLLSKLLYNAIYKRVSLSKKILQYYYRYCEDAEYKSIVKKIYSERINYATKSKRKKDNRLIALSNSKIYTLEEIIQRQKGKLVLLDLWASWCAPCLEQMPIMKKLHQQFANDKISFIYLSMDREILQWKHKSGDICIDPSYSFLFENFEKQSFLKIHNIEEIPRYILLYQNGKIINADTPGPDDPALKNLIEQHLQNP